MNKKKLLICVILGFILILVVIITIMVIGSKTRKEEDQPMFQRVKLALEDEDPQVGLAELKYYLDKRPDSAEFQPDRLRTKVSYLRNGVTHKKDGFSAFTKGIDALKAFKKSASCALGA